MRTKCLVCSKGHPLEEGSTLDYAGFAWGVCHGCLADAKLGRLVRKLSEGQALFRQNPEWAFRSGYSGNIFRADTPEAALEAAGVKENKE